jgi:hypothetical protein
MRTPKMRKLVEIVLKDRLKYFGEHSKCRYDNELWLREQAFFVSVIPIFCTIVEAPIVIFCLIFLKELSSLVSFS